MASVNKVILVGNLGKDPDVRDANEVVIANLSLATTRRYRRGDETVDETEWHRVVFFGRLGEIAQQYLRKGSSIYVEGRLRTRKYEKDGVEHYTTEIIGEQLQMLNRVDGSQAEKPQQKPQQQQRTDTNEDVPF